MSCMNHVKNTSEGLETKISFEKMEGFPSAEVGIEKGVSACFAGIVDHHLLLAGGCNFPDTPAAEGGKKKFYKGIYAAKLTDGNNLQWQLVGWLPEACAYGVAVEVSDGLLCMGGCNAENSMDRVYKIRLVDGKAVVEEYPSLPWKMDNFAGTVSEHVVMVYDGVHVACLDLHDREKGWQQQPALVQDKLGQPVCGYTDRAFHVWGGSTAKTDDKDAVLMLKGWRMDVQSKTVVDAPCDEEGNEIYLGGASVINCGENGILALGGVNKDVFEAAVNRPQPGYMTHPQEWYRFNPYITLFNDGKWEILGKSQITARAGAALAKDEKHIYVIGGELKPGIRTPEIYRFSVPGHQK